MTLEEEKCRALRIVKDIYAGHFDEYFEQYKSPEQGLREAIGNSEAFERFKKILDKNSNHKQL